MFLYCIWFVVVVCWWWWCYCYCGCVFVVGGGIDVVVVVAVVVVVICWWWWGGVIVIVVVVGGVIVIVVVVVGGGGGSYVGVVVGVIVVFFNVWNCSEQTELKRFWTVIVLSSNYVYCCCKLDVDLIEHCFVLALVCCLLCKVCFGWFCCCCFLQCEVFFSEWRKRQLIRLPLRTTKRSLVSEIVLLVWRDYIWSSCLVPNNDGLNNRPVLSM